RDWSSDVCSSDLNVKDKAFVQLSLVAGDGFGDVQVSSQHWEVFHTVVTQPHQDVPFLLPSLVNGIAIGLSSTAAVVAHPMLILSLFHHGLTEISPNSGF